jgi:hypothetical protein
MSQRVTVDGNYDGYLLVSNHASTIVTPVLIWNNPVASANRAVGAEASPTAQRVDADE